jgi:hypothetical protein
MSVGLTTFRAEDGSSTKRRTEGIYTGPASYATGGESILAGALKLGQVHLVLFEPASNGTVIILLKYDYTNSKVKAFDMAGAEIANATDLSTYTARFEAIGV